MYMNFDLNKDGVIQRFELKNMVYTLTGLTKIHGGTGQNGLDKLLEDQKKLEEKKRLK